MLGQVRIRACIRHNTLSDFRTCCKAEENLCRRGSEPYKSSCICRRAVRDAWIRWKIWTRSCPWPCPAGHIPGSDFRPYSRRRGGISKRRVRRDRWLGAWCFSYSMVGERASADKCSQFLVLPAEMADGLTAHCDHYDIYFLALRKPSSFLIPRAHALTFMALISARAGFPRSRFPTPVYSRYPSSGAHRSEI